MALTKQQIKNLEKVVDWSFTLVNSLPRDKKGVMLMARLSKLMGEYAKCVADYANNVEN